MQFADKVRGGDRLLVEGSMFDRLKRLAGDDFDSQLAHLGLVYSERGQEALRTAYGSYADAARATGLPIVLFTPTWRANQERVSHSSFRGRDVNQDGTDFLVKVRESYAPGEIFIGGLVGCKNDCYSPKQGLASDASQLFHAPQIAVLGASEVDFLFASTLPAVPEAIGLARAMADTDKPYILSFVADSNGLTLDGRRLEDAFAEIDRAVSRRPLGYFVNCTHPVGLLSGLQSSSASVKALEGRLIGFQGNTSRRDPRDFDSLPQLESEDPSSFASATMQLRDRWGLRLLGGCCGTGPEHIQAIGNLLKEGA
ncbi:MAG: homocysteine S-methyltransferase protein [Pseudomonadota bacterium]